MAERVRLFVWRQRRLLAALWLSFLVLAAAGMAGYYFLIPAEADRAIAVLGRALAYRLSFGEVRRAQADLETGRLDSAKLRLIQFLRRHNRVQSTHLETHAVTDAALLLGEVEARQGKVDRSMEVIAGMTRIEPLEYRLWLALGQMEAERGDLDAAAKSLRQAFLLAPNHPGVTDAYLEVLGTQVALEEARWVEDQFVRASRRGLPAVEVRAGAARSPLRRRLLTWVGIPVAEGSYVVMEEFSGLPRGERQVLDLPAGLIAPCPRGQELYLQLRFDNVYDGVRIDAIRFRRIGGEEVERPLGAGQVAYLHRPGSGRDFYAEVKTGVEPEDIASLRVVYSCPEYRLSEASLRLLARAHLTAQGWRAP